jgi:putative transposase
LDLACVRARLQPCRRSVENDRALAAACNILSKSSLMAKPTRNADPTSIRVSARTFFVTTKASAGRRVLQSERNALLLIDVLRAYVAQERFQLDDFVIMPDHIHLLITVHSGMSVERAMQLIKGGFSYRLKKETGYLGEVWQRGFSDARIDGLESWKQHRRYIAENPVKAGLCDSPDQYPFCFTYLARQKARGLKPDFSVGAGGTTKVVP